MRHMNIRKTLSVAALAGGMIVATNAMSAPPKGAYGSGYSMGSGMMGGGMMNEGQGEESRLSRTDAPGSAIFRSRCASCHRNGGNVITPYLPLNGSRKLVNFKTFLDFIRHPKMPDGSQGAMPAFGKSDISDQQAERLYRFITAAENADKPEK